MKTTILATATVLAALLFAPMAYAYECHPYGDEIRCTTRDPYDLVHEKITVKNKNQNQNKKKTHVSFTFATSMVGCGENRRPIGAVRVDLVGGHVPGRELRFQNAVSAFTDAQRRYKKLGKEACFEVVIYNCEERTPPFLAKISCDLVVDVTPGNRL